MPKKPPQAQKTVKQKTPTYRVCYKVVGYPNGKLENIGEKYFTDVAEARKYAEKHSWETPTKTSIAWVEETQKTWVQI